MIEAKMNFIKRYDQETESKAKVQTSLNHMYYFYYYYLILYGQLKGTYRNCIII